MFYVSTESSDLFFSFFDEVQCHLILYLENTSVALEIEGIKGGVLKHPMIKLHAIGHHY